MNFFNLKNSVIDGLDTPCMGTGHLPEVKVLERTNRLPTFFIFQMKTNGLALNNKVTIKLG